MHPMQMLLEVIQSGPPLGWTRAVDPETHVHHLRSSLRLFVVYTFLMTSEVVDSPKPFFAGAVRFVAFEQFPMTSLMFSEHVNHLKESLENISSLPLIRRAFPNPEARTMITSDGPFEHRWRPDEFG